MDPAEKINNIAYDSTTAVIDRTYALQSQAVQLGELWFKTISESQKAALDLTKSLVKSSLEAQSLWRQYTTESVKDLNQRYNGAVAKTAEKAAGK